MNSIDKQQLGPRLLIKFLQDAAGKGDLDPWDIDVISVIDSFLEQYAHTFERKSKNQKKTIPIYNTTIITLNLLPFGKN